VKGRTTEIQGSSGLLIVISVAAGLQRPVWRDLLPEQDANRRLLDGRSGNAISNGFAASLIMKMILGSVKAVLLMALGLFVLYEFYPFGRVFAAQSAQTEGTLVQVLREGWSRNHGQVVTRAVKVVFTTNSGKEVSLTTCLYEADARDAHVGKKLPVRYDPHDPSSNDIGTVGELSFYIYGIYAAGGGLVLAGFVLLFRMLPAVCAGRSA